jgi:hypothetical protein
MNDNKLKNYTFRELMNLCDSLFLRVKDMECKIASIYILRNEKSVNVMNMWSQIKDYNQDISDIKLQMEKLATDENKH